MKLLLLLITFIAIICAGAWKIDQLIRRQRNEHGFPASRRYYRK